MASGTTVPFYSQSLSNSQSCYNASSKRCERVDMDFKVMNGLCSFGSLYGNHIGNQAAIAFPKALRQNQSLTHLEYAIICALLLYM
jgi:hypothetical protein